MLSGASHNMKLAHSCTGPVPSPSLSFSSAIKGSRGRGTPEGVSTHALKQQTVVVGIEVGGQEKGVVEASFQLPVKLFGHAPWNGTERNLFN